VRPGEPCHIVPRVVLPGLLSQTASYDVASNNCQALVLGRPVDAVKAAGLDFERLVAAEAAAAAADAVAGGTAAAVQQEAAAAAAGAGKPGVRLHAENEPDTGWVVGEGEREPGGPGVSGGGGGDGGSDSGRGGGSGVGRGGTSGSEGGGGSGVSGSGGGGGDGDDGDGTFAGRMQAARSELSAAGFTLRDFKLT